MNTTDDPAGDIREFLTTRRARIAPEESGLTSWGTRRRVPGLRRDEVAQLAGISVEYYTRLERGQVGSLSPAVFDAVAAALQLDDVEAEHLAQLIHRLTASATHPPDAIPVEVPRGLLQVLDAMASAVAFIRNERLDVLAANGPARTLYASLFDKPGNDQNLARFVFLDADSRSFYRDWDSVAADAAGSLRALAAHRPTDPDLQALIRDLTNHSPDFRRHWEHHDVRSYRQGTQAFHHPLVGDLDLDYVALRMSPDEGLILVAYTHPNGRGDLTAIADGA